MIIGQHKIFGLILSILTEPNLTINKEQLYEKMGTTITTCNIQKSNKG